jgi:hypothetical protein
LKEDLDTWITSSAHFPTKKLSMNISQKFKNSSKLIQADSFKDSMNELNFKRKFFQSLKRGGTKDIEYIKESLSKKSKDNNHSDKHLLRRGNTKNLNGEFPLYVAAKYNHIQILKILLNGLFLKHKIIF